MRYARLSPAPVPLPLQLIGWKGHGKTSYAQALLLALSRAGRLWDELSFSPATEASRAQVEQAQRCTSAGTLPQPSGDFSEPLLILLHGLPRWGGTRAVFLQDAPGHVFDHMGRPLDELPFLHRSGVALMFFSLSDLGAAPSRSMSMLLDTYVECLLLHGLALDEVRPRLVVVLTKGECVEPLPDEAHDYLARDPIWLFLGPPTPRPHPEAVDLRGPRLEAYISGMRWAHETLAAWLARTDMGANFLRLAEHYGVTVRFTMVSATGSAEATSGRLLGPWQPRRVLNPLLWALELDDAEPA